MYQHNKTTKTFTTIYWSHHNNGKKYDCDWDSKTFCFNFDLPKDVDENLKRETELIIKRNESLAEIIRKNEIEQLLLKYKHRDNVHKHRK